MPSSAIESTRAPELGVDEFLPVVGKTTAKLIAMLRVFVNQGETVLICGPTGAGKSRLARWCHEQSSRSDERFETLDLLSVPANLQMAELVGWKRGAFTGATCEMSGALTRAANGTLFIDEIDKLSLDAQAGLLRILDERRYRALGDDSKDRRVTARFIVGTNVNLRAAVREGRFREDLYYRINVLPVHLPPLAERVDELPRWAEYMLGRCGPGTARLSAAAIQALCVYSWPGNLRQLDNVIRRAFAFAFADCGPASDEFVIAEHHVVHALEFEQDGSDGLTTQVWRVAQAVAREFVRRGQNGDEPVNLEVLDGFRGMVLGATVELLASREHAFRLFGREHLLVGRNHHRALKRELLRARRLLRALGDESCDASLSALLGRGNFARESACEDRAHAPSL